MEDVKTNESPSRVRMMNVRELAEILRCSPRTVHRLVDAGRAPAPCRLGALVRWSSDAIETWIAAGCPTCRKPKGRQNSRN
jgi:excisionase family DNA binding protein